MKIVFTCGGTAGHINPALAMARLFMERKPECEILFVGAAGGMEERLVPLGGFSLQTIAISPFRRKLNLAGVRHNLENLKKLYNARQEAGHILANFKPDLVVGTGGYASYPIVREAARMGIPTAVHESNAIPGLTTRRLAKYADRVMAGLPASQCHYPHPERVVLTGTPVRGAFFELSRREARVKLGIPPERPVVLSYWGSLGADLMNRYMVDCIEREANEVHSWVHIHGAGRSYAYMLEELARRRVRLPEGIQILEYIDDMPCVMQAADLVLCRGGASTISELSAIGRAAIIVPSPNVTNNHQEKNANVLASAGAAVVIPELACSGDVLFRQANHLLAENEQRAQMEQAMAAAGIPDAADRIYQTLMKLLQKG